MCSSVIRWEPTSIFNAGKYKITLTEEFVSPDNWVPGETIPKTVTAKNDGTVDAAVRISYTEQWTKEIDGVETDITSQVSPNPAIINFDNTDDWTLSNGKYYYKYILKPTDETSSFISGVTLDPNLNSVTCTGEGNTKTCEARNEASGAKYKLTFTIETIQYDVYESEWNTNVEITEAPEPPAPGITWVNTGKGAYFDPVTNNTCDSTTFSVSNVKNGTSTCYKWNILNQNGSNTTLILDHSLGVSQWDSTDYVNNGPRTLMTTMKTATTSWERVPTLNFEYDTTGATGGGYGVMQCTDGACHVGSNANFITGARVRVITAEEFARAMCETADWTNFETNRACSTFNLTGVNNAEHDMFLYDEDHYNFNDSVEWLTYQNMSSNDVYNDGDEISTMQTLSPSGPETIWVNLGGGWLKQEFYPNDEDGFGYRPVITVPTNLVSIVS